MPPTNSSRLSSLTQLTTVLERTQESIGLFLKNTTKESSEVLLQPVRNTEVSDKRVIKPITEDHLREVPGRREILKFSEEDEYYSVVSKINWEGLNTLLFSSLNLSHNSPNSVSLIILIFT